MQTIRYCDSAFNAHLIVGRLANEGIEAAVINENLGSVIPHTFAISSLRAQVVVADEDAARALEILNTPRAESCPSCGSTETGTRFPAGKRRSRIAKYLLLPLALLTGSPVGNIRKVNYCKKCGCEFPFPD